VDGGREEYIRTEALSGQPESVVRRELDGDARPWKQRWSPRLTPEVKAHYAAEALYAKQAGLIGKPLDTSTLYAPQFVEQALVDLKLQQYWAP
jgi:sulfonate transport system substrate-binding protein